MSQPYLRLSLRAGQQSLSWQSSRRAAFARRNLQCSASRRAENDGDSDAPISRSKAAFNAIRDLQSANARAQAEASDKSEEDLLLSQSEDATPDGQASEIPAEAQAVDTRSEDEILRECMDPAEYQDLKEIEQEIIEGSDTTGFSQELTKYFLEEHRDKKGPKPYDPQEHDKDELLRLTQDSLPPLPGVRPQGLLQRYIEGTVQNWNPPGSIPILNANKENAKRLLEGLPVKFFSEADKKAALEIAASDALKGPRLRTHEKLRAAGYSPSEKIRFQAVSKEVKAATERRIFTGAYKRTSQEGETPQEKILNHAKASLEANASYKLKNEGQFMEVIKGLTEGKPRGRAPKMGLT